MAINFIGILFVVIIIIFLIFKILEIRQHKKYTPVTIANMDYSQKEYILKFLMKIKFQMSFDLTTAHMNYGKELSRKYNFRKNIFLMQRESRVIEDLPVIMEDISGMVDKLRTNQITDNDLPELNNILDKKRYRMKLAWQRLLKY